MKIVIEVPKEYYENLKKLSDESLSLDMLIIKYGTPLKDYKRVGNKIDTSAVDYYNWENECLNG